MTPFAVTENEYRILKQLKKLISLPDLRRKFRANERQMIESLVSRLVCYGVVKQERIEIRIHPKATYAKTMYIVDDRELVIKHDDDVKYERTFLLERDQLFMQFGINIDPTIQQEIVALAGRHVPRSEIAKRFKLKKKTILEILIANEKELETLRRKYDRSHPEVKRNSESA